MDEHQTIGVTRAPVEPMTLDAMIETVKQISEALPKCWHHDLITSKWLPPSANGITYACARCFKLFTVPAHLFGGGEVPKRISIDYFYDKQLKQRKENTIMSDGFSNEGVPTPNFSAPDVMTPLGSSSADGFNVPITTSDVKAGFNNIETVTLQAPDGSAIFCEHHQLGVLGTQLPQQDVPPGETQARP